LILLALCGGCPPASLRIEFFLDLQIRYP